MDRHDFMLVYLVVLLVVIGLRPQGLLSYSQMTGLLAIVEIALGIYVGQIVLALFKKEEKLCDFGFCRRLNLQSESYLFIQAINEKGPRPP